MTPDADAVPRRLQLRPLVARAWLVVVALALQGCTGGSETSALLQQSWTALERHHWPWQRSSSRGKRPGPSSLLQRSAESSREDSDGDSTGDSDAGSEEEEEDGAGVTSGDVEGLTSGDLEAQDAKDNSEGGDADSSAGSKQEGPDAVSDADAAEDDLEPGPASATTEAPSQPEPTKLRGASGVVLAGEADHDPAAEYTALVQRHASRQQKELNSQYQKMLYLSDPDDIDKAMKLAWMKMEYEDRSFTGAMQNRFRPRKHPPHRVALQQLSERTTRASESALASDAPEAQVGEADKVALAD